MDFERLDQLAYKYMGRRKSHKEREMGAAYYHGRRVAAGALELRKRLCDDDSYDDVLRCAGMFHDIGKGVEPHNHTGAILVRDLLKNEMTELELNRVCTLIEAHCDRHPGTDQYPREVKILQDADLLDHYGSQGIWMCINFYAYATQQEMDQVPIFYMNEWKRQVAQHEKLLNFELSKKIFEDKVAFERQIAERMDVERLGTYYI